jgi:hypothetical protein
MLCSIATWLLATTPWWSWGWACGWAWNVPGNKGCCRRDIPLLGARKWTLSLLV